MKLNIPGRKKDFPLSEDAFFYDFQDACRIDRCPLCYLLERGERQQLEFLFYENVNDPVLRKKFRAAGGLCHQHTESFLKNGDALGLAIIGEDLLSEWLKTGGERARTAACPFCEDRQSTEERDIKMIRKFGLSEEFWPVLEKSVGFCRFHFHRIVDGDSNRETALKFIEFQRRKLAGHLKQLQEVVRKHDYRFREESIRPEETESIGISWRLLQNFPDAG